MRRICIDHSSSGYEGIFVYHVHTGVKEVRQPAVHAR